MKSTTSLIFAIILTILCIVASIGALSGATHQWGLAIITFFVAALLYADALDDKANVPARKFKPRARKVLFALMVLSLLSAGATTAQNKVVNMTQWNLDRYVNDYLAELKIDSCIIVLQQPAGLIYNLYHGLTIQNTANFYTVAIYKDATFIEACMICAHELVHVKQFKTGALKLAGGKFVIFNGAKIQANTAFGYYNDHEDEAYKLGKEIYYKYKRP